MSLKKVEVYQTHDGAIHKTKAAAVKHELDLYLADYAAAHAIEIESVSDVLDAIIHQPVKVSAMLKTLL